MHRHACCVPVRVSRIPPGSRRHRDRRDSSGDIWTGAGLTVTGKTRTISGEERAFVSTTVVGSVK